MIERPTITGAPGLAWRQRKGGWEARWICPAELRARGYPFKVYRLLTFSAPPEDHEVEFIQARCQQLQGEVLAWAQKGVPTVASFDGRIRGLIDCYRGMRDSPYNKKARHVTRGFYDRLCISIIDLSWTDDDGLEQKLSQMRVSEIRRKRLEQIHETYVDRGCIAMGHQVMGMLRTLFGFGAGVLEDSECARLCMVMSKMRFQQPPPRNAILTAEQATLIRQEANKRGIKSMALAQAFQFDGMLRQKDVIGEWVPITEKRTPLTDIVSGPDKWIRGLRWEEIDKNMILTHITSKRLKSVTLNLRYMPMVMEELGNPVLRSQLPDKGPIIISERTMLPWDKQAFRMNWRACADQVGIPKEIRNQDTRAGAITEATMSGAPLESIKHAATHSDISMTQRYARAAEKKTEDVQRARMEYRNKTGN